MISVPVRCSVDAMVMQHAHRAGLEGVIGPEAAGDQSQLKLQAAQRFAFKCQSGALSLLLPDEMQEEGQDRVLQDDGSGITQHSLRDVDKVSQSGREVMLGALLAVPEEFMTGMGGKPVAGEPVVSAGPTEQGFIR